MILTNCCAARKRWGPEHDNCGDHGDDDGGEDYGHGHGKGDKDGKDGHGDGHSDGDDHGGDADSDSDIEDGWSSLNIVMSNNMLINLFHTEITKRSL